MAAIAWENYADSGVLSVSGSDGLMTAGVLQQADVGQHWRAPGTAAWIVCDLGAVRSIDVVALLGINITASGTVRVRVSATDPAGVAGLLYDSAASTAVDWRPEAGGVWLMPAPVGARYVRIDLADASLPWIEAGRLVISALTRFAINFDYGWSAGRTDLSRRTEMAGGQTIVERRGQRRTISVTFSALTEAEAALFDDIDAAVGLHTDVLFIRDPAAADRWRASLWGLPDTLEPVANPYFETYSRALKIVERL